VDDYGGRIVSPTEAWQQALADVLKRRPPAVIAPIVRVERETVRRWLRGVRVPTATVWRALVIEAKMEDRWPELSAARDAVERKPTGRPRLSKAVRLARLNKQIQEVENE
jgi:hypothetical protein